MLHGQLKPLQTQNATLLIESEGRESAGELSGSDVGDFARHLASRILTCDGVKLTQPDVVADNKVPVIVSKIVRFLTLTYGLKKLRPRLDFMNSHLVAPLQPLRPQKTSAQTSPCEKPSHETDARLVHNKRHL
jgi:hypothetical protein